MNVLLIGFKCSGKTTVGRMLAQKLERLFVDTDEFIEDKSMMTISEIFELCGEPYFRQLESQALCEICKRNGQVISTGGGAVIRYKNVQQMKRTDNVIVYLDIDHDTAFIRMKSDPKSTSTRPQLTKKDLRDELKDQLVQRRPSYLQIADCVVDAKSNSPERVCNIIAGFLRRNFEEFRDVPESL